MGLGHFLAITFFVFVYLLVFAVLDKVALGIGLAVVSGYFLYWVYFLS